MARRLDGEWLRPLAPLQSSLPRALIESLFGYSLLLLGARVLQPESKGVLLFVLTVLGLLWLAIWPAWRLRPLMRWRWWKRAAAGAIRAVAVGFLLALAGWLLADLLSPPVYSLVGRGATVAVVPMFVAVRLTVMAGASVIRPIRRRLRWQLMASHIGVIVLIVVTLTFTGSVIGLILLERGIAPSPTDMATSVADDLRLARSIVPFDRPRTLAILDQVATGRLPQRGEPALASIAPSPLLPDTILLLSPNGRPLTAVQPLGDRRKPRTLPPALAWRRVFGASPTAWSRLRRLALAGRPGSMAATPPFNRAEPSDTLAEAPVRDPSGKIAAVVVLRVSNMQVSSRQFVQGVIALFGVSTIAVILLISLPMLALSFLFSYLVARGLTRRLESVSYVARAIASGNLSERAPVTSENEVGRLAEDVNRMAERLGVTMGELREARLQAEQALQARQALVANVSHELRTPLAILRAHLETLLMRHPASIGPVTAENAAEISVPASTVQALQIETERLATLVDDLFTLSRAEGGALNVRREPVDVAAVVDEIARLMRPLAQQDGMVTLSVEAKPGLPFAVADAERLRQILSNLVRNAVRHTPEGGIVVLAVTSSGPWVVVTVADTGEGISTEHVPHVFERFYRVDQERSRGGGAGLGLAIVRELVELMGGRIEVESASGEGTCFRVFLPVVSSTGPL